MRAIAARGNATSTFDITYFMCMKYTIIYLYYIFHVYQIYDNISKLHIWCAWTTDKFDIITYFTHKDTIQHIHDIAYCIHISCYIFHTNFILHISCTFHIHHTSYTNTIQRVHLTLHISYTFHITLAYFIHISLRCIFHTHFIFTSVP